MTGPQTIPSHTTPSHNNHTLTYFYHHQHDQVGIVVMAVMITEGEIEGGIETIGEGGIVEETAPVIEVDPYTLHLHLLHLI